MADTSWLQSGIAEMLSTWFGPATALVLILIVKRV